MSRRKPAPAPSLGLAPTQEISHAALSRISYLMGRGANGTRMASEAAAMISGWAATLTAEEMGEVLSSPP